MVPKTAAMGYPPAKTTVPAQSAATIEKIATATSSTMNHGEASNVARRAEMMTAKAVKAVTTAIVTATTSGCSGSPPLSVRIKVPSKQSHTVAKIR